MRVVRSSFSRRAACLSGRGKGAGVLCISLIPVTLLLRLLLLLARWALLTRWALLARWALLTRPQQVSELLLLALQSGEFLRGVPENKVQSTEKHGGEGGFKFDGHEQQDSEQQDLARNLDLRRERARAFGTRTRTKEGLCSSRLELRAEERG
jgi:hypothetical protein